MKYDEIWSSIEIVTDVECCEYCGQPRLPVSSICQMCQTHQYGVVYGIIRELLIVSGNKILEDLKNSKKGDASTDPSKLHEIALSKVLDAFPLRLAKRCGRFEKALLTEGVWFSHLVAFWMVRFLRKDKKWPITRIVLDEMYFYTRDHVYDFLKKGEKSLNPEAIESFQNFYYLSEADRDARGIIFTMMLQLEKEGRIKIVRPKSHCIRCDAEFAGPGGLCPECRKDESLDTRLTISAGMDPPPLLQKEDLDARKGMTDGLRKQEF